MKKGDKVECVSLEGFAVDSVNYMLKAEIKIGSIYTIGRYGKSYGDSQIPFVNLIECSHNHPASSFKLVE